MFIDNKKDKTRHVMIGENHLAQDEDLKMS